MITRRQIEKNCFRVAPMMPQRLRIAMVVLLSLACVAAAQATEATTDKWEAPPDAAAKANPEAQNPGAPAAGRKLFMHACVTCHGEDGSGGSNTGAADLHRAETQGQSDGALFWKITNGNTANGMPSFAALPETGRWDIVTFLRTLKESTRDGSGDSKGNEKGAVH